MNRRLGRLQTQTTTEQRAILNSSLFLQHRETIRVSTVDVPYRGRGTQFFSVSQRKKKQQQEKEWTHLKGYNTNPVHKVDKIIDGLERIERFRIVLNK